MSSSNRCQRLVCVGKAQAYLQLSHTFAFSLRQNADHLNRYHCQTALTELGRIYKSIATIAKTSYIDIGDVSRWQVFVSMGYIRLLRARSAPALVILAYYAAAMTAIRTAWYTQNWAEYAIRGIHKELPPTMHEWIQWPLQQVQDQLGELGVRSPNFASAKIVSNPIELV